jgi:tetratricopeptide (TPR) repeat protein
MGTVYRAQDLFLGRTVALKVHKKRPNAQGLRRFLQEARAAQAISHPNIATTFDAGSEGNLYYLAMELVSGTSLSSVLRNGAIPWPDAVEIIAQISAGLAAAHRAGVMHRDLKPSNVMIGRDGIVKLVDFGLAKQIDTDDSEEIEHTIVDWASVQTSPGAVLGTPAYMSPEQARGRVVDARADVFSVGVLSWEMIAGQALFRRNTPAQTLRAIIEDQAPSLIAVTGTPAWLVQLISRCLEKEPLLRFSDAAHLSQAVGELKQTGVDDGALNLARLVAQTLGPRITALSTLPPANAPWPARQRVRESPFVGRIEALQRVDQALSLGARLVSIVGERGVGKSRLAAEYVVRQTEPVVWVDIARATDERAFSMALAFALGLSERDANVERITRRLVDRSHGLLVLDGIEGLGERAEGLLTRIIDNAPRTQFLVTTSAPFSSERSIQIALEGLSIEEGIEHFRRAFFEIAPDTRPPNNEETAALVRCLQQNPLAIAFVVQRVSEEGVEPVLELLQRSTAAFDLRQTPDRIWPTALSASFQLLSPSQQHLLITLSIFDTFDLRAVEGLVEAGKNRVLEDELENLARQGILRTVRHPDLLALTRYALPDSLFAFASSELRHRGDEETLAVRHAAHYANLSTQWIELLRTDPSAESWRELLAERGNLLLAGQRALARDKLRKDYELWLGLGTRAVSSYAMAAFVRSSDRTHVPLLAQLIQRGEEVGYPNGAVHAEALLAHAELIANHDAKRAALDLDRALAIASRHVQQALRARIFAARAELHVRAGRTAGAIEDARQSGMIAERLSNKTELQAALLALVHAHAVAEDLDEAAEALRLAERIAGERDDAYAEARIAMLEGDLHVDKNALTQAILAYERALELAYGIGDLRMQGEVSLRLAELAHRSAQFELARARYATAAQRARETNDPRNHGRVMLGMGLLELDEERFVRALALFREAQAQFAGIGEVRGEAFALAGCAAALATRGDLNDASSELTRATLLVRDLDVQSKRVVGVWAGFLDVAVHPGEEGLTRARARLGRVSFTKGAEVVTPPLVREAYAQAALVLERRIQDLEAAQIA